MSVWWIWTRKLTVFVQIFQIKIIATVAYLSTTNTKFHMVDMISTQMAFFLANMVFLLQLWTESAYAFTKLCWYCFTASTIFSFTHLTNWNVQTYHVDCRHIFTLTTFTKALINVHIMFKTNGMFTCLAFVFLWFFSWVVISDICYYCALCTFDFIILMFNTLLVEEFLNQSWWNWWCVIFRTL